MGIFAQVWFWSALAFLAGALLSWALLALPARRQLARLDHADAERERVARPSRPAPPPLPERPSRYDDEPADSGDRFDRRDRRVPSPFEDEAAPPILAPGDGDDDYDFLEPARRPEPEPAARTELLSSVDSRSEDAVDRGSLRLSDPTVQVPVSGSLGGGLFAPPEPPIPSPKDSRPAQADESATQFLPAVAPPEPAREVKAPPEVDDPSKRGWFDDPGEGGADENKAASPAPPAPPAPSAADTTVMAPAKADSSLVDDLEDPSRHTDSGELVDDVLDLASDEEYEDTGTIFNQRTQPVSGDLISRLDAKAKKPQPAKSKEDSAEGDDEDGTGQTTSMLPVRTPGANRFDTGSRSQPSPPKPSPRPKQADATQAMTSVRPEPENAPSGEPDRPRSLFEPVVPADEAATTAMRPTGGDDASATRGDDGSFVPPGPFGPGSAMPLPGGGAPSEEFKVKASVTALRYCEPDSPLFGRTVAEVWFRTTQDAERVGFRPLA